MRIFGETFRRHMQIHQFVVVLEFEDSPSVRVLLATLYPLFTKYSPSSAKFQINSSNPRPSSTSGILRISLMSSAKDHLRRSSMSHCLLSIFRSFTLVPLDMSVSNISLKSSGRGIHLPCRGSTYSPVPRRHLELWSMTSRPHKRPFQRLEA